MAEKAVGGLKWVKGEIALTLSRVRHQVEAYRRSGNPADLGDSAEALFEIRGVLLALQLTLPARLVDEMQRLCDALVSGLAHPPREAAEALLLALIQLPSHLERMAAGAELPPLVLWPTINDLRGSRGAAPLTQAELLVPASVLAEEDEDPPPEALEALAAVARKVRPHFHRHLLEWYRPETSTDGLVKLGRLFQQLHRFLRDGTLADLFRLAESFVDGLQAGQLVVDAETRSLVGHIDLVFKPLIELPPAWPAADALALIDEFLTELAKGGIQTPVVLELQAHYGHAAAPLIQPGVAASEAMADASGDLSRLGPLAAELLEIEAILRVHADQGPLTDGRYGPPRISPGELHAATLREACLELAQVKDAILLCQTQGPGQAAFTQVPDRLTSIAGALLILGDDLVARLTEDLASLVRRHYVTADRRPLGAECLPLENLIAALDIHLGRMAEGAPADDDLLDLAQDSLNALERLLFQGAGAVPVAPAIPTGLTSGPGMGPAPQPGDSDLARPFGLSADMTPQVEGVEDDPLVDRFAEPLPGPPGDVDVLCSADEFLGADGHQRTQGADLLDRLVDIAWETSRCGARLDQANGRLGLALDALEQTVNRLRDQWRLLDLETQGLVRGVQEDSGEDRAARADLEPDRLSTIQALSRPLNETVGDLTSLQGLLAGHQREAAGLLTRQVRLIDALKDGLERTRMAGTP